MLWEKVGANVVAREVARGSAASRAGIVPGDVLILIDGQEIRTERDITAMAERSSPGRTLGYVVQRQSAEQPVSLTLQLTPLTELGLYYSLAIAGILSM